MSAKPRSRYSSRRASASSLKRRFCARTSLADRCDCSCSSVFCALIRARELRCAFAFARRRSRSSAWRSATRRSRSSRLSRELSASWRFRIVSGARIVSDRVMLIAFTSVGIGPPALSTAGEGGRGDGGRGDAEPRAERGRSAANGVAPSPTLFVYRRGAVMLRSSPRRASFSCQIFGQVRRREA